MNKSILPDDLKSYRAKRIIKISLPFIALLSLGVTACLSLSYKIPSLEHATPSKVKIVYAVLLILPFVITGFPKKLIDKSWCGEIIGVDTKIYNTLYSLNNSCTYTKASIVLTVKLSDKKTKEVEVFATPTPRENSFYSAANWKPDGKVEYQESKHNVGDKVYHLYLFDHLLIESKKDQTVTCVVCGAVSPKASKKCAICDHSILRL